MLVVTLVLLVLLTVGLFARSWDFGHGPGIMSKLKILLSHFQAGLGRGRGAFVVHSCAGAGGGPPL